MEEGEVATQWNGRCGCRSLTVYSWRQGTEQHRRDLRIVGASSDELFSRQDAVAVGVQLAHDLDHLAQVDVGRRSAIGVQRLHAASITASLSSYDHCHHRHHHHHHCRGRQLVYFIWGYTCKGRNHQWRIQGLAVQ